MSVSGREPGPHTGRGTGAGWGACAVLAATRSGSWPTRSGKPPVPGCAAAGAAVSSSRASVARQRRMGRTLPQPRASRAASALLGAAAGLVLCAHAAELAGAPRLAQPLEFGPVDRRGGLGPEQVPERDPADGERLVGLPPLPGRVGDAREGE